MDNLELTCKYIDATTFNAKYWVFCGALTDVEWWMDAINNANPSIHTKFYNAPGKMASFGDVNALAVGPNRAPAFTPGYCDSTLEIPRSQKGFISARVDDANGDELTIGARVIAGSGQLTLTRELLPGLDEDEVLFSFQAPDSASYFVVAIEADDQQVLLIPACLVEIRVK